MHYVYGGRAVGRTTALIEGMRNQPNAILIVHNEDYALTLRKQYPELEIIVAGDVNKLRGLHKCILPDHFLIQQFIQLADDTILALQKQKNIK